MIIAIDGPAGSGKSTISRLIARRLGIFYVDTGAMYRAVTLKAMRAGADLNDEDALVRIASGCAIDLRYDNSGKLIVILDGEDVSRAIRAPELTNKVRFIARIPGVREHMVNMQREIARSKRGAVLEGRDIGTVVLPDADRKFYLDADAKERARRRHKELMESGTDAILGDIERDVTARDKSDMTRQVGPLKQAHDAIVIDTTTLSIERTVEKILSYL